MPTAISCINLSSLTVLVDRETAPVLLASKQQLANESCPEEIATSGRPLDSQA